MKISFLIAAHNEEKLIRTALENLFNLPYKDFEVIIGLDGCTDGTEDIIKEYQKKSNKFKCYKLNLREGKPAVINSIIKHARGDLIVIHDADWKFEVKSKEHMKKFISVFDDPKVGGIAEAYPMEYYEEEPYRGDLGYQMVCYSAYYWFKFQNNKYSYLDKGKRFLKEPRLFMTNILRRELYENVSSLGDDFERTIRIMEKGFKIALLDDPSLPRMRATYTKISLKDLFKQKIRTARAREQIQEKGQEISLGYYLNSILYMTVASLKNNLYVFFLTGSWIVLTTIATVISKFKKFDTKQGWRLRAKR